MTGHYLTAPLDVYNREYFNAKSLGLQRYDPAFVPPTLSRQIHDVYRQGNQGQIANFTTVAHAARQWWMFRVPLSLGVGLPTLLLTALIPIAMLGLRNQQRWVVWSMYACHMVGSACFYLFAAQYVMAVAPSLIFTVLLGADTLARFFPPRGIMAVFLPLAIVFLAMHRICLNEQGAFNPNEPGTAMQMNYEVIPKRVKLPALVMFHYDPAENAPLHEPVYNWDALTPDDASLVRAHDLGELRNLELYRYYARVQPNRNVYLYDHMHQSFGSLGVVKDIAQRGSHESRLDDNGERGLAESTVQ